VQERVVLITVKAACKHWQREHSQPSIKGTSTER